MLEGFKYINSFNETLEFGKDSIFVNENDLRDFAWGITSKNDKIIGFKKGVVQKTIPVILNCRSENEGIELRNRMFEVFEKDVLVKKYGKIQIGDYYLQCYITGSKKTQYLLHNSYMVVSLTVQTDRPEWIKETTITNNNFVGGDNDNDYAFLDYSYDYLFDFSPTSEKSRILNTNFIASNFVMTIFGGVSNPAWLIGGHKYAVNVSVEQDEYLTIDSTAKTIVLTKANGEKVNCFSNRGKDSYVFEKIPAGDNEFVSSNITNFTITLLDERSEPKWT